MTNQQQPQEDDAVLGGNTFVSTAAVLGGMEGIKRRLGQAVTDNEIDAVLVDAAKYGDRGREIIADYFDHVDHIEFFIDMAIAGYSPQRSGARFWWKGPIVHCENKQALQKIIRKTEIDLIWDNAGKDGCIVYPRVYGENDLFELFNAAHDREDPLHKELGFAIQMNINIAEPMSGLIKSLIAQIQNY